MRERKERSGQLVSGFCRALDDFQGYLRWSEVSPGVQNSGLLVDEEFASGEAQQTRAVACSELRRGPRGCHPAPLEVPLRYSAPSAEALSVVKLPAPALR